MIYKNLGNTGLKVSAFGLGCGNFGGVGSAPAFFGMGQNEYEAFEIMDTAVEMGINFFDTADAYGGGRSETMIGNWLRVQSSAVKDKILISSKLFNPVGEGPNDRGLSRRQIMRQVEASLKRVGVEQLDLYLIHEPDRETPLEETLRAMDDLVRQGKVHYIGASNMPAWLMTKALWLSDKHGLYRFEWVQNSFSLLDQTDAQEMLSLCRDQKLGYTPFSPLSGGFLTGKYKMNDAYPEGSRMTLRPEPYMSIWNERTFSALEKFSAEAEKRKVSMAGLALAWLLHHPDVTAPIIGPKRPSHFDAPKEALTIQLTPKEQQAIGHLFTN